MPLNQDAIIQSKTGNFESTSGTVTLDAATTAGNMVLIMAGCTSPNSATIANMSMTGFDRSGTAFSNMLETAQVFSKVTSGSETSWTLSMATGGSQQVTWMAMEVEGVDQEVWTWSGFAGIYQGTDMVPLALSPSAASLQVTSGYSGSYDTLAIAAWVATAAAPTVPTVDGYTGNFQELATVSRSNGSRGLRMSVAARNNLSLGPVDVTASISPSSPVNGIMVVLTGTNSRHAPIIRTMSGAEIGTASNLNQTGSSDTPPFDEVTGTPEVSSTFKRTGNYSWRLSSSAAIENMTWLASFGQNLDNSGMGAPLVGDLPLCFYFDTSLPGSDVELFSIESAGSTSNSVKVWYRTASQKIGVKVGTGTEQVSDATVAANKWIGVELLYDPRTTTHSCQWQIDYDSLDATGPVAQTTATNTGMTAGTVSRVRFGWTANTTATVYYDDIILSGVRKAYPMGLVNIRPLRPDPAGTATISGSSGDFRVFTSNGGTLTAWSSAGAISAMDEIPPTIGASADGVCQITTSGSTCTVPLETYTLVPNDFGRGVRMYALGWAASATAASMIVQGSDGTNLHSMGGDATDAGFDTTGYWWLSKTFRSSTSDAPYVVSQAIVDGLAITFGQSGDAAPDIGLHWVLAELATQPATVFGVSDVEAGAFTVYVRQDPLSAAVASYLVTTPSGSRGATFTWTVDGSDGSQYVGPNTTYEKNVGATDISQVTAIGLVPDPTI